MSYLINNITLRKLILVDAGYHAPMYIRPYEVNTDGLSHTSTIQHITDHMTNTNSLSINAEAVGVVNGNLISPSANQFAGVVDFSNSRMIDGSGFFRFLMEIDIVTTLGKSEGHYLQGYTSHKGVASNGSMDPNMMFYVNSVIKTRKMYRTTPQGQVYNETIESNIQILTSGIIVPLYKEQGYTEDKVYLQRPTDVISQGMAIMAHPYTEGSVINATHYVTNNNVKSNKRANNSGSQYFADIINAGVWSATRQEEMAGFDTEVNAYAQREHLFRHKATDPLVNDATVLKVIHRNSGGYGKFSEFRVTDLLTLFNYLDSVTTVVNIGGKLNEISTTPAHGEHWNTTTLETKIAYSMLNSITAIATETFLTKLVFIVNNFSTYNREPLVTFIDTRSFLEYVNVAMFMDMFKQRFINEVFIQETFNNTMDMHLEVHIDVFGTSKLYIELNGNPGVWYTAPSFADSMYSPVLHTNLGANQELLTDVFNISEEISGVVAGHLFNGTRF